MPLYKYKFVKNGKEYEQIKEFVDKGTLYSAVRAEGSSILQAEEVESKSKPSSVGFFSFNKGVNLEERIAFAKNLAVMIDAGLSVSRALAMLQKQSKNKAFKRVLESVSLGVNGGESLSKSFASHPDAFGNLFVSMTKAGEESGKLGYSLKVIASQLEKSYLLSKKIKGAMIYPGVIISAMVVIGILLMVYMVPTLTETFRGLKIDLPLPTRVIIAISDFLRANIIATLATLVVLAAGIYYGIKTRRGQNMLDTITLHTPMIGNMSREVNAARTSRTLSSLVSAGVDIVSALRITSDVLQNHYFQNLLKESAKQVEVGELLSASLAESKKTGSKLYPVFVGEMLAVGEETGKVTEMLDNIANFYEAEVEQKTKDLSTVIEPFLMILIGITVGIFAIAMMLPTYSLVDAIQ